MPEITQITDKELQQHLDYRGKFASLLAGNQNFFGTNPVSKLKAIFPLKYNTTFEELGCIGYQPVMEELTATIKVRRPNGYGGNLCSKGSAQYVRFFMDYGNGLGWQDMGMTAVNVHDIPDTKDCSGLLEKPLSYVVRQKIDPMQLFCSKPNLPRLRAVLSWNSPLPEDQPFPFVAWGDAKETTIQVSPLLLLGPLFPIETIGSLLTKALQNPNVSLNTLAATTFKGDEKLVAAANAIIPPKTELADLVKQYAKLKVEPERMGVKILDEAVMSMSPAIMNKNNEIFTSAGLDWAASLKKLIALKGNTTYEELHCVGADYHKEALVATLQVKKSAGYSGDLCKKGSKEYVAFWIQTEPDCKWVYAGSAFVTAHDIDVKGGLSYAVVLPFDFSKYRRPCSTPVVLKVRGVLSWNVAPSATDPNKVPYWGNIVDAYIQIAPGFVGDGKNPVIITLGGVAADHINDTTGLTDANAVIEFNQAPVYPGSPFGGTIVIQGISDPFAGSRYRVKVKNLNTASEYYVNGGLQLIGYDPSTNQILHPIIFPDNNVNNYYTYQPYLKNIGSILARFNPGTNDLLEITIENENGGSVTHRIQMDNESPVITLTIEKDGCGGYAKGDVIKGTYSVKDAYLLNYTLGNSFNGANNVSGTTNVGVTNFSFPTAGGSPCGNISLIAYEKTIWNSVGTGNYSHRSEVVCLK